MYHFLFHLRELMQYLAAHPIEKKTTPSMSEVAQMLSMLPRRAAFIRSGDEMGVIYTDDSLPMVTGSALRERVERIRAQTRQRYCKPKAEVEKELMRQQQATLSRSEVV